jgi:hypothetical protein
MYNNKYLDVSGSKDVEGQSVGVWGRSGGANQRWRIVYLDKHDGFQTEGVHQDFGFHINRPFYIRSRLPMKRVVEMVGASNIVLKRYVTGRAAQQFVFHGDSKHVQSNHWKNYCIEIHGNGGSKNIGARANCISRWWQIWRYQGTHIVNEKGKVFDIEGGVDVENRNIIAHNKHNGINQQFDIIYVDEYPAEPKKGEFNADFGLYVERPFYIVSELPDHRYLDLINNRDFAIKVANGRNTQVWYFDQKSLTIKTKLNNQSWDIKNSGKTRNMQVWSTNSQWF